ncbi:MAG: hypothetical protein WA828_08180 [Coleofasciculaceae cyanobacterium]
MTDIFYSPKTSSESDKKILSNLTNSQLPYPKTDQASSLFVVGCAFLSLFPIVEKSDKPANSKSPSS